MTIAQIDPELAAAVAEFDSYEADWIAGDLADLRRIYAEARAELAGDSAKTCSVETFRLEGSHGLVFTPANLARNDAAIVYFHGGSWCVGSPETHYVPCSHLAVKTGMRVWSVLYRLAPENKFPAQQEDGVAAVAALLQSRDAPQRLVLSGDSAGAAVAFWTEHGLPDELREKVSSIVGFYGGYGHALIDEDEIAAADDNSGLSRTALLAAYERLGPLQTLRDSECFVISNTVRADGPPCYVAAAACDPLVGDSLALARTLGGTERRVELDVAEGMTHSYLHYVARSEAADAALSRAAQWIVNILETN